MPDANVKSPWNVMRWAHAQASAVLPDHASRFSRKDYTLAQLFACLVLREMLGLSFRATEAVLRDADWCQRLGMRGVPDHSTLCRAFKHILTKTRVARMLELVPHTRGIKGKLGTTLAIDSTLCETHHRSKHYERRCRQFASTSKRTANARRSRSARRTPKLGLGIDTRTHLILSAKAMTGMGSDAPDFHDALYDAWKRHNVKTVLADAGYDSEANHRLARLDMNVRSLIKAGAGRPSVKPASGRYRRLMQRQLSGSQKGKPFGQRAQAETVMSMIKRNLGDALRARSTHGRKMEMLLKVLTHNLMIIRRRNRGSQHSRCVPVSFPGGLGGGRPLCHVRRLIKLVDPADKVSRGRRCALTRGRVSRGSVLVDLSLLVAGQAYLPRGTLPQFSCPRRNPALTPVDGGAAIPRGSVARASRVRGRSRCTGRRRR